MQIWANSLDNFERKHRGFEQRLTTFSHLNLDEFATLAVQKYLYDSMADIGNHMEALATRFIPTFTKLGMLL